MEYTILNILDPLTNTESVRECLKDLMDAVDKENENQAKILAVSISILLIPFIDSLEKDTNLESIINLTKKIISLKEKSNGI